MAPIQIMVNGLPGNVARVIAEGVAENSDFTLIPWSLTGPEIEAATCTIAGRKIQLLKPDTRDSAVAKIRSARGRFITVDFTHPSAVNANAEFYRTHGLDFVMGTTGGDREKLAETVEGSKIAAVIAPNMAKQIVGFQAMLDHAASAFPDLFKGYCLTVKESHQQGKADTSGTAKAVVADFNRLGIPFEPDQIQMERSPEVQKKEWGIPEKYLDGHGWHTYTLVSADRTVTFEFTHNINGRGVYVQGTLDAVSYLDKKISEGAAGKVFSMIDVLKKK